MITETHPKLRLIFIPDGGQRIGMGHVQQSTTLAQALSKRASVFFLTKGDAPVLAAIMEAGFGVHACTSNDAIYEILQRELPDIVIFDSTEVDVCLVRRIRTELNSKIVVCTNLTEANSYAHMVVLQRAAELALPAGGRFRNESFIDSETGTRYFYGPTYWVLRPEFYTYRELRKPPQPCVERILLTFGGSDPTNLTTIVLATLLSNQRTFAIDVLLGRHFAHHDDLMTIMDRYSENNSTVNFYRNARNVAELMFKADLSITAAGMSMFESLCVGTPVISIPQDKLQRDTYQGVIQLLELVNLSALPELIEKGDFTYPGSSLIQAMEIGAGLDDLIENIFDLSKAA